MLGKYLGEYMKDNGLKQVFVSEKTGISPQKLGVILKEKQKITAQEYFKICEVIGIDPIKPARETGVYSPRQEATV